MPRTTRSPAAADAKKPPPKSGKQKRKEIIARREVKAERRAAPPRGPRKLVLPAGTAPCNAALLAVSNSYGPPDFVLQGFYTDVPFTCMDCAKQEVWTATQQKWWYEIAKGHVYTTARRCRACRRRERERAAEARRVHLEGLARVGKVPIAKKK